MAVAVVAGDERIPWTRWVARTFLGWCAGFVLAIAFIVGIESLGVREVQFPLAMGMGLGVGVLQARTLAPLLGGARPWITATTLGLSAPFMAADLLGHLGAPVLFSLAGYVGLGGLLAGALQWRLLRARATRPAWWLLITPIGWLLGGSTVWINEALPKTPGLIGALQYVAVVLAGGLVLGAAGAVALRLSGLTGPVQPDGDRFPARTAP